MEALRFSVQGSASTPYELSAWGEGSTLKLFCSCPAGRKGALFCKHVAQLLVGEVTNVVAGVEHIVELARRAAGTHFIAEAINHTPRIRPPKPVILEAHLDDGDETDVSSRLRTLIQQLRDAGWYGDAGIDGIVIYGRTALGKRRSVPFGELCQDEDDGSFYVSGVTRTRRFSNLAKAAGAFSQAALAIDPSTTKAKLE